MNLNFLSRIGGQPCNPGSNYNDECDRISLIFYVGISIVHHNVLKLLLPQRVNIMLYLFSEFSGMNSVSAKLKIRQMWQ